MLKLNRRIRNRTYGGVGGRGRQRPLLPDAVVSSVINSGGTQCRCRLMLGLGWNGLWCQGLREAVASGK